MEFGLPAAIGAKVTAPNNVQYDVDGACDGFSVRNNEFQGMARLGRPRHLVLDSC